MKVSELRIGNLLRDKVTKTELRVTKLTEQDIVTYVIDRSMFPLQDGWGIEPIPLTEEWLLKFGFKKIGVNFQLKSFCLWYSNYEICYVWRFMNIWEIEGRKVCLNNVHQLQNLYFALTGEELIFKQQEQ